MVRPEPIKAIVRAAAKRSAGRSSKGYTVASAIGNAGYRRVVDDAECDVRSSPDAVIEALAHIFAEQLPRQEGVCKGFMQARLVLSLIKLTEGPIQKVAGLAGAQG